MANFSDKPWDGSASRWGTPEAYCSACLIDVNPKGQKKVKDLCHLPVKEPAAVKRKAARALVRLYKQMAEVAPESVYRVAGMVRPKGKG